MEARKLLYTVEEFEQLADSPENRDRLLELINGEIVEKVPTKNMESASGISIFIFGCMFRSVGAGEW
jgi:Uma2 family endonuclease